MKEHRQQSTPPTWMRMTRKTRWVPHQHRSASKESISAWTCRRRHEHCGWWSRRRHEFIVKFARYSVFRYQLADASGFVRCDASLMGEWGSCFKWTEWPKWHHHHHHHHHSSWTLSDCVWVAVFGLPGCLVAALDMLFASLQHLSPSRPPPPSSFSEVILPDCVWVVVFGVPVFLVPALDMFFASWQHITPSPPPLILHSPYSSCKKACGDNTKPANTNKLSKLINNRANN